MTYCNCGVLSECLAEKQFGTLCRFIFTKWWFQFCF